MTRHLIDEVQPGAGFLRATNIEVHGDSAGGYIPTSKALELLSRFARANRDKDRGQSWSLTGPYGSGKSSFAVFLSNLLGARGRGRDAAESALRAADEQLATEIISIRERLAGPQGFLLATTTTQQEPVVESLLRAADRAIATRWGGNVPPAIKKARSTAHVTGDSRALVGLVNVLSEFAPVLLILDEFGKTLEHFAARAVAGVDVESDLFVLQELAERSSGSNAIPLFTFTLQHLAFDDYVRQASSQQRREWGKVQGRFEDVSFVESAEQSLRLVAGSLDWSSADPHFIERRNAWAADVFGGAVEAGMANHLPGGLETVEQCYPLHPVALLALPELSARLGQHGRTLFTFLASSERATLRSFLQDRTSTADHEMDVLRLPDLFDFFAGTGQSMALSIGGSRWREILERVLEASHLPPADLLILKSVGLLNLVGNNLGLRASTGIIAYALSDATAGVEVWRGRLDDLESRGFVTFRAFADEYRLWQGSDVDLRGRVADAREQLRTTSAADLLTSLQFSDPIIAARHSQRVGMLRYFSISYSDDSTRSLSPAADSDPADGRVVYHLGSADMLPSVSESERRPTVFVTSAHARRVREAAIELAAALGVLDQQDVLDDRVARRELQDRVADARTRLKNALAENFSPAADGVTYRVSVSGKTAGVYEHVRSVSALLSEVCDDVYSQSPEIRNEMLARRELTSQGAKARRMLIDAMISRGSEESLGITGYGPDRAMYEAVLRFPGLHVETPTGWAFSKPTAVGGLLPVWGAMTQLIDGAVDQSIGVDELYRTLSMPPLGVKDGPIPVLLTALLLQRSDDVAIYEAGSFQPSLTADLLERLVKAPARFRLKSFGASGSRAGILKAVAEATSGLGISGLSSQSERQLRNGTVLAVAAPLLNFLRSMPTLTRKTARVSKEAAAVRLVLMEAREPDVLIFKEIPDALGITASMWKQDARQTARLLTQRLSEALLELQTAYGRQLEEVLDVLAGLFGRTADASRLREALRYRAEPLEGRVIDPKLQAFIFNVVDDSTDDRGWLELMGLVISGKTVQSWADDDREKFMTSARELANSFLRVEALNFDMQSRNLHGPFTARRLSVTTPDGQEFSKVVYYDQNSVAGLNKILDETLERASTLFDGPESQDGLLALLFERLVGQSPQQPHLASSRSVDSHPKEKVNGR